MNTPADFTLFLGRFHPLLVHLPIGFLVVLGALEVFGLLPRFKQASGATRPILMLLAPAALATALCGWLLSRGGGYDEGLVDLHFWTGLGVAALSIGLLCLHMAGRQQAYRVALFATIALMGVSSHFGGSLTHGKGFLTRYAPAPLRALLGEGATATTDPHGGPGDAPVYASVVQPILHRTCVGCHGPEKSKAGMRVDSLEAMLAGGDSGPCIVPGNAPKSLLVKRVLLPLDDDDHMPPEGKPQPSADEIKVLQWWIDTGASDTATIRELEVPDEIAGILEGLGVAESP